MGNSFYSLTIPSLKFHSDKLYGLRYGFYLEDAIGDKDS